MAMPIEYRRLIVAMSAATAAGRVKWTASIDEYSVKLSDALIILRSGIELPLQQAFVEFALRDADRTLIDAWSVDQQDPDYKTMNMLVVGAKRSASDLSNKLSALTEIFNNPASIGGTGDATTTPSDRYGA